MYGQIEQGRNNIFVTDLILLQSIFKVDYRMFFKDLMPLDPVITGYTSNYEVHDMKVRLTPIADADFG